MPNECRTCGDRPSQNSCSQCQRGDGNSFPALLAADAEVPSARGSGDVPPVPAANPQPTVGPEDGEPPTQRKRRAVTLLAIPLLGVGWAAWGFVWWALLRPNAMTSWLPFFAFLVSMPVLAKGASLLPQRLRTVLWRETKEVFVIGFILTGAVAFGLGVAAIAQSDDDVADVRYIDCLSRAMDTWDHGWIPFRSAYDNQGDYLESTCGHL